MGLSQAEQEKRRTNEHVQAIKITKKDDGKDFLFVSYKSDDWEIVLQDIVYTLNTKYGLRVYFDREFDQNVEHWLDQFEDNMESPRCKGVLAFIDDEYATSYATLLELMYCKTTRASHGGGGLPVFPVYLKGELGNISDDSDTGLGSDDNEKAEFDDVYEEVHRKGFITKALYKKRKKLSKWICSEIVKELICNYKVHKKYFSGTNKDTFYIDLTATIKNKIGDSVFEQEETFPFPLQEETPPLPLQEETSPLPMQVELPAPAAKRKKARRMKLAEMVEKGIVQTGDAVYVQGHPEALGTIAGGNDIQYQGHTVSLNQYVKQAFGDDASRNAYEYVYHKTTNKLLTELRDLVPSQESLEAAGMELGTKEIAVPADTVDPATDLLKPAGDLPEPRPAADEIIRPAPLTLLQSGAVEKREDTRNGFREDTVYKYRFFGETASLKILSVKKGAKVTKVDAILLAGSAVKKLWEGGSVDYRMANGGKKSAKILYDQLLPGKAEEFKEGYLKVKEDILIKDASLSAIATMVSGASVAPAVAWRE